MASVNLPALLATGMVLTQVATAATLITNDGFVTNNQPLPGGASYGSNVTTTGTNWSTTTGTWGITGTPDIALTWAGAGGSSGIGFDTFASFTTHGRVIQLDGVGGGAQPQFQITFTPNGSAGIALTSFDLISGNTTTKSVAWSITGTVSGTLASGTWTGISDQRDTITANANGLIGETLTLTMVCTTGPSSFLGFDNLGFDQITPVPEPGTVALGSLACGLFAMRRRRA